MNPTHLKWKRILPLPRACQIWPRFLYQKLPATHISVGKELSYNMIVVETGGSNCLEIINCYK